MRARTRALAVASLLLAGCTDRSPEQRDVVGYRIREIPDGLEIQLPPVDIEAGEERMICAYVKMPEGADRWVSGFRGLQHPGGHHIAAFLSTGGIPDGTIHDCTDPAAMTQLRPLLTGTADNALDLPEGYAVKLESGTMIAFQSHYVNASPDAITVRDLVEIHFSREAAPIPVANFATAGLDFEIEPQSTETITYRCTAPEALDVFTVFGHMHDHGAAISIEAGAPGARTTIYEIAEWSAEYRDEPPLAVWPMDAPLHIAEDEAIDVTCTWSSTAAEPLRFPEEMCAAVLWFFPAEEPLTCAGTNL